MDAFLLDEYLDILTRQMLTRNLVGNIIRNAPCDICTDNVGVSGLIKCVLCSKYFCCDCKTKAAEEICKICHLMLANKLNSEILNRLSLKEVKMIATNYKINLSGALEKRDIIEAILRFFKKSVNSAITYQRIDIEKSRTDLEQMKIEDINEKERRRHEEENKARVFHNLENATPQRLSLENVTFNDDDALSCNREDLEKMSVKELKQFLASFRVSYVDVVEKKELKMKAVDVYDLFTEYSRNVFKREPKRTTNQKSSESKATGTERTPEFDEKKQNIEIKKDEKGKVNEEKLNKPKLPPITTNNSTSSTSSEVSECIVCLHNPRDTIIIDCRHFMFCNDCITQVYECPYCRTAITQLMKVFT